MTGRFADDYRAAAAAKQAECARNRDLILRHGDLAKRLSEPPLRCNDPRTWSGYIPGNLTPEDAHGRVAINTSPIRAQLLELLVEACERADAQQAPAGAPQTADTRPDADPDPF